MTNFAHALFDTGSSQCQESGINIYQAPECGDYLDFTGLKLTDVYSLGVIFANVACKSEEVSDLNVTKNIVNNGGEWSTLLNKIFAPSQNSAEGLRIARDTVYMIRALFLNTLQTVASNRNLDRLLQSFNYYFGVAERPKYVFSFYIQSSLPCSYPSVQIPNHVLQENHSNGSGLSSDQRCQHQLQ